MSSIVEGFEYDVFISYRHNDNLPSLDSDRQVNGDGRVSESAANLQK